jgi:uncharacterized protein
MRMLVSLFMGLIFGLGLILSGMANPAKVQNFLDVFGLWDPSLAFVMGGALVVTFLGYRFVLKRPAPFFGQVFHLPKSRDLDGQLISGASLFGLGWGLSGFCPGPALTAVGLMQPGTLIFVPAMLAGMALARALPPFPGRKAPSALSRTTA